MTYSMTLRIGAMSGLTLERFYSICDRHGVEVVSCVKMGGMVMKSYRVQVKGSLEDIETVRRILN